MFEVFQTEDGKWGWRMISAAGRTLVEVIDYPSNWCAATCAKDYRVRFWRVADRIDHRMARCI